MSSVNSVRIPGLATGMDTDQMIKDMLVGEQNKVDSAKQKEQITKWQQESYREIIKSVKGLYDKYFSSTSPDFILSSKVYSTTVVNSSNSNVISATAGAGANNINYKFKVEQMAQPPRLESKKIDKNQMLIDGESSNITINGKEITIKDTDKISDVVKKINDKFPGGEVKASYSEMTGKLTIEGGKTGESSKIDVEGDLFKNLEMVSKDSSVNIISNKIDKEKSLKEQGITGNIKINGTEIPISEDDTIDDLINKINRGNLGATAKYDEKTGQLNITSDSEIKLSGNAFEKMGIDTKYSTVSSRKLYKEKTLEEQGVKPGKKTINGKDFEIKETDTVEDLVKKINDSESGVKAVLDESTQTIKLESKDDITFDGLGVIINKDKIERQSIISKTIIGRNNSVTVYDNDRNELKKITEESNSFTIDNITYDVKGVTTGEELVSMTSTKDTKKTVEKVQAFIDDYNKIIEDIYDSVTEKKNRDYPPLTEAQKEDMSEEEIEKWEKKAKEGLLKNDKDLRAFMDDIKKAIFAPIGDSGITLSDLGIQTDEDYNKQGQLKLNVDKFTKALEDNGDLVYKATTEAFEKIKDVAYNYAGSSSSVFVKKAGMDKTSTEINNLFSEQLRRQEEQIKNLTRKMNEKEESLYKKFAKLESNMNTLNSQMSYLMSSMGM